MTKPKSALEELVEAASGYGIIPEGYSVPIYPADPRPVALAHRQLAALAPDMARAGQVLADFVTWAVPLIATIKLTVDQESRDTVARVLAQAETDLATWRKLGEAEERRDE